MSENKRPCFQCEKRVIGCHVTCEDYKVYSEERQKKKSAREAYKNNVDSYNLYSISKLNRLKKYRHRQKY
jgi:hypothetical protein